MFRRTAQRVLLVAVLAMAVFVSSAQQADAGWRHWRGYYPGYGYAGYYGGWYGGYYGYPVAYASYYRPWYSCYSGCYSSCWSPCYYPCYSTCGSCYSDPCSCSGTVVSSCCGTVVGSVGAVQKSEIQQGSSIKSMPTPAPADTSPELPAVDPLDSPLPGQGVRSQSQNGSTVLAVTVPEQAKVYVNGKLTSTPGTHRRYISRGLVPGFRYTYEVRAELERAGQTLTDTRVVQVRAGETSDVAFRLDSAPQPGAPSTATTLTLHVPAEARVTLGGNETASRGTIRQFTTTDLPRDQKWQDYQIVVTMEQDGELVQRERTITVSGGESRELVFSFTEDSVAAR